MTVYDPSQKIRSWNIWYFDSGWVADGTFPRAGIDPFTDVWSSTSQMMILANGSQAHTSPEKNCNREELVLTIPSEQLTTAYNDKIKAYICSGAGIRIQTHEADTVYLEGYITSIADTWRLSGIEQKHIYAIGFQMFDIDGSGFI